jgi:hypothetical protein
MLDEHGGVLDHEAAQKKAEKYGSGDPILPWAIGGGVAAVLLIAMHTAGDRVVHLSTTLAFIADMAWLFGGVFIALIWTIIIWIPESRPYKWTKMGATIIFGIMYYVVSGIVMAHASLPIS